MLRHALKTIQTKSKVQSKDYDITYWRAQPFLDAAVNQKKKVVRWVEMLIH